METKRVLGWVMDHVLPGGGIESWHGSGQPYPEITGYTIPTLIKLGKREAAKDLTDWLVKIQNNDGSWNGLNGQHCTFDTAACVEGLKEFGDYVAVVKGLDFIEKRVRIDKSMERYPKDTERGFPYLARAAWILGDTAALAVWRPSGTWPATWGQTQRPHYIAYLLEGLFNAGHNAMVRRICETSIGILGQNWLMPMWASSGWQDGMGTDLCATCQFALLYLKNGMISQADRLITAVESQITPSGGIPQALDDSRQISWAAKYYLDICAYVEVI